MTFPIVQTADTKTGLRQSNGTSWTCTWPTNIAAGDLLLAFFACDGTPGVDGSGVGLTHLASAIAGGACDLEILGKIAAGNETGTFTVTVGASEQGAWRIFRITGYRGTAMLAETADTDGLAIRLTTNGSSNTPDPPDNDPANWATEDTLWVAAIAVDTSRTVSGYPSNMPDLRTADVSGGSTGATLGIAMLSSAVASVNPGTFAISASDDWAAATVAIRPAGPAIINELYAEVIY